MTTETYVTITSDGNGHYPGLSTPDDIFENLDMQDCHGFEMRAWRVTEAGDLEPLVLRGPWHNPESPLSLAIETASGETLHSGWGTDH